MLIYGQNESDTIKVVTLQNFSIPTIFHHVTKVRNLSLKLYKITANGQVEINNNFETIQSPNNRRLRILTDQHHGIGPSVQFNINGYIEERGNYQLMARLSSLGDFKSPNKLMTKSFNILVEYPVLTSAIELRSKYYLGEKTSVSFAMSGLSNRDDYSYTIIESDSKDTVKSGLGPVVYIDSTIINNENLNKQFNLEIKYRNRIFDFELPNGEIRKSIYPKVFSVVFPIIIVESMCGTNINKRKDIVFENEKARRFRFIFQGGSFNNRRLLLNPKLSNIRVRSKHKYITKDFKQGFDGLGYVIELKPSKAYKNLEFCNTYEDIISISFTFKSKTLTYHFYVNLVR